jgi:hypothetical protein
MKPSIRIIAIPLFIALTALGTFAGPPFLTDDPEPVEFHHWEFYLASQIVQNAEAIQGALPQIEVNFGLFPETQIHVIAPLGFSKVNHGTLENGPGDVELGIKLRFIKEQKWVPQIGTFPHVEIPVGDSSKGLGTGRTQIFLPLWLQKSIGKFETYGGGGCWISPGYTRYNLSSLGWLLQYNFMDAFSAGAEIFRNTAQQATGQAETGFNAGAIVNFGSLHHILFSAGTDIRGSNRLLMYAAYQLTI